MTNAPLKRNATYADLMDLPDNVVGEIVGGDLYATPRPRMGHAFVQGAILVATRGSSGAESTGAGSGAGPAGAAGWWIVGEPELHLDDQYLVPDLAGWRQTTMPSFPADAVSVAIAPDWICEIVSPSTALHDRVRKLPAYARAGVAHAWLVDPVAQTLEVLELRAPGADADGVRRYALITAHGADDRACPAPFAAHEFDLATWWPPATTEPAP